MRVEEAQLCSNCMRRGGKSGIMRTGRLSLQGMLKVAIVAAPAPRIRPLQRMARIAPRAQTSLLFRPHLVTMPALSSSRGRACSCSPCVAGATTPRFGSIGHLMKLMIHSWQIKHGGPIASWRRLMGATARWALSIAPPTRLDASLSANHIASATKIHRTARSRA
ncbi:hypothetical protein M011DRAFT_340234 [Sporormia fimetaria CBS 119925]|uniref:Uncharacterized protein n=1 Tax=Sporormia fimetaria CBS 119925 TaxID=1340428 RepID=A0A6A6VE87_9PLEO|nr:hypothetical protein M011DRAFT_340234 [Sporormia fimetaria CBS 119925]